MKKIDIYFLALFMFIFAVACAVRGEPGWEAFGVIFGAIFGVLGMWQDE